MSRTVLYTIVLAAVFLVLGHGSSAGAETSTQAGEPIQMVEAKYPKHAVKQRIEGVVVLHVTIATDGKVKNVSVLNGNSELVPAAIDAVRKWRFQPFVKDGNNIEGQRDISIPFTLTKASPCAADIGK